MPIARLRFSLGPAIVASALLASCADPNPPLPPPLEIVAVFSSGDSAVYLLPTGSGAAPDQLAIGDTVAEAAVGEATMLAAIPDQSAVLAIDLRTATTTARFDLPLGPRPVSLAVVDDSIAYLATPESNSVIRLNYLDGSTAQLAVGTYPQGLLVTRGRLFVVNGNLGPCPGPGLCALGPSWLTVVDPVSNTVNQDRDSIPLLGPGNARFGAVGGDGLLYVMSRGSPGASRLSIVDPVGLVELASFGGFGDDPGQLTSDGVERLFISSRTEGLMEFNTRSRQVVRGAGSGVAVPQNSGVAVDSDRRVYASVSGGCQGSNGSLAVLDTALAQIRSIPLGPCAGLVYTARFPLEASP